MNTLKTIDGKDFKKSFEANMLRINFFSSTLKCEANFSSIKNKLGLDNNLVKRLEKLKELGEKKGCSVVQLYFRKIQREEFKFDEQKLSNLEKLVEVWDDYYSLNKTYNILLNECIDLLEKIDDDNSKGKLNNFLNIFKDKFKKDIENIELNKMKKISTKGKEVIASEEYKIKKYIVGIGDDAKDTTLFSFLRCNIYMLFELRDEIETKNKDYKERIEYINDIINNWDYV